MVSVQPRHPIVHQFKFAALLEIDVGENHRRQRSQRQYHRPETYPQVLFHNPARQRYAFPLIIRCKSETNWPPGGRRLNPFISVISNDKKETARAGYVIRKSRYGFLKPKLSKLYA